MIPRMGTLAAAAALLLLAPVGAPATAAGGLRVRANGPAWESGAITLTITPEARPPAPRLAVVISAGDRWLASLAIPVSGGRATFSTDGLPPGRHRITVRSGSAEGGVEVRVLPRSFGPAAAALLLLVLLAAARLATRPSAST